MLRCSHRRVGELDLGPQQVIQQQVALHRFALGVPGQTQVAIQPQLGGRRGRLTAVIRLRHRALHQGIRALGFRRAQRQFQLPGLVAPERQARVILPFHQDARPAKRRAQPRTVLFPFPKMQRHLSDCRLGSRQRTVCA